MLWTFSSLPWDKLLRTSQNNAFVGRRWICILQLLQESLVNLAIGLVRAVRSLKAPLSYQLHPEATNCCLFQEQIPWGYRGPRPNALSSVWKPIGVDLKKKRNHSELEDWRMKPRGCFQERTLERGKASKNTGRRKILCSNQLTNTSTSATTSTCKCEPWPSAWRTVFPWLPHGCWPRPWLQEKQPKNSTSFISFCLCWVAGTTQKSRSSKIRKNERPHLQKPRSHHEAAQVFAVFGCFSLAMFLYQSGQLICGIETLVSKAGPQKHYSNFVIVILTNGLSTSDKSDLSFQSLSVQTWSRKNEYHVLLRLFADPDPRISRI